MTAVDDGLGDAGDLVGGLALAEHHLWKPLADGAVVVDAGESEVLERLVDGAGVPGAPFGVGRVEVAIAHGLEQRAKRVQRSEGRGRAFGHQGSRLTPPRTRP